MHMLCRDYNVGLSGESQIDSGNIFISKRNGTSDPVCCCFLLLVCAYMRNIDIAGHLVF
jgi:hypothetical protein